jgi:hypothetical protein
MGEEGSQRSFNRSGREGGGVRVVSRFGSWGRFSKVFFSFETCLFANLCLSESVEPTTPRPSSSDRAFLGTHGGWMPRSWFWIPICGMLGQLTSTDSKEVIWRFPRDSRSSALDDRRAGERTRNECVAFLGRLCRAPASLLICVAGARKDRCDRRNQFGLGWSRW